MARKNALSMLSHFQRESTIDLATADRLADLIDRDVAGLDALYMRAVASPDYDSWFGKALLGGPQAIYKMTSDEMRAVQIVERIREMRGMAGGFSAGMSVGSGGAGEYAVPFDLDPRST